MNGSPFQRKHGLMEHKLQTTQRGLSTPHNFSVSIGDTRVGGGLFGASLNATALVHDNDLRSIDNQSAVEGNCISNTNSLFLQFLEILQSHSNDAEVFECIHELTQACSGVLDGLQKKSQRGVVEKIGIKQHKSDTEWLREEINTWKLLYVLYHDRVIVQLDGQDDEMNNIVPTLGASEKEVIAQLFILNATLREYQLIVDWLETCYERPEDTLIAHVSERSVAWENTLFQLNHLQKVNFSTNTDIVKSLDPDAPIREKRSLHALDVEDNLRLSRSIFTEVRRGNLAEATALCKYFGQTWRAAVLEGWRLHDDPNYDTHLNPNEKIPTEGNPRRDIWKKCAWMMADSKKFDDYTRAIAGALCGHLESLKSLLSSSWQDLLWGYMKVQIDIRVESELRSSCMKSYYPMPDDYWNGKMTLEQIFDELIVAKDASVRDYAKSHVGIIQQHLILDNIGELMQQMCRWLNDDSQISIHKLRFFTHIILFMRQIGRVEHEQLAERIITAYVEALIERGEPQLIAYYAATLPNKLQVNLYSKFLEKITETTARSAALDAALYFGLDVEAITTQTVDAQRILLPNESDNELPHLGNISEFDRQKISALEWLTFLPSQRGELLWQTNAMIRQFLGESKTECVRAAFKIVPSDSITHIFSIYGSKDNLPCREDCSIKEYLCYKAYLTGIDCFNDWSQLYHNKPQPPQAATTDANFTERFASEHKKQNYLIETQRWESTLVEHAKMTTDALYNVLLFPEKGWLTDPDTTKVPHTVLLQLWEHRQLQMEKLRSICIPEVAILLHKVMHQSGDYTACVKLADEIADENRQLYKVYPKHKLAELLSKIGESSLQLLNKKLDAWGYSVIA